MTITLVRMARSIHHGSWLERRPALGSMLCVFGTRYRGTQELLSQDISHHVMITPVGHRNSTHDQRADSDQHTSMCPLVHVKALSCTRSLQPTGPYGRESMCSHTYYVTFSVRLCCQVFQVPLKDKHVTRPWVQVSPSLCVRYHSRASLRRIIIPTASTRQHELDVVVSEYDRLAIGLYFVTTLCITAVHEWCTRNSVLATEVTRDGTLIGIITKTGFTHLSLALNLISCDPGVTDHPSSTLACRCVSEPRHRISPHFTTAESLASTGRWSTTMLPARWAACPPKTRIVKYHDVDRPRHECTLGAT